MSAADFEKLLAEFAAIEGQTTLTLPHVAWASEELTELKAARADAERRRSAASALREAIRQSAEELTRLEALIVDDEKRIADGEERLELHIAAARRAMLTDALASRNRSGALPAVGAQANADSN